MEHEGEVRRKRPATWLAVVLNLVAPPIGYAYVGALAWAAGFVGLALAVGVAAAAWSLANPPGLLGDLGGFGGLQILGLAMNVVAAIHVAWLNRSPRDRGRLASALGIGVALWLLPLAAGLAGRYLAPFATYSVASASMSPTLEEGDVVLGNGARAFCGRTAVEPGDVIFAKLDGVIFAHRAVAGPGQIVQMVDGRLSIDGRPVVARRLGNQGGGGDGTIWRETLSSGRSYLTTDLGTSPLDDFPPRTVPDGHWFAMGDNRDNAFDSRVRGPIAASRICGVAVKVLDSDVRDRIGRKP